MQAFVKEQALSGDQFSHGAFAQLISEHDNVVVEHFMGNEVNRFGPVFLIELNVDSCKHIHYDNR